MKDILDGLNPAQRAAVENFDGPSLIIAGAGSGKTRVLTSRIAYMITKNIKPYNILAMTFTNKAANEMRERIAKMVPKPLSKETSQSLLRNMGTFHSIFMRILRAEAEKIGYPPAFTIYDTTDSVSLIKSICREMLLPDDIYKPKGLAAKISRLKNDLITPAVYEEDPAFITDDRKRQQPQFIEVYKRYVAQCRANGAMDFDDLLVNMVVLFKQNRDVLAAYQARFKYILVDEYQDTNRVQYLIVKALSQAHGNVCVVGDDSQSIYSFRGARIENILNFTRDFPSAQIYKLEQNYRSTQTIVNAANSVIARNRASRDLKKECFSDGEVGERIRLIGAYTDREEAELVATEIRDLGRKSAEWDEIAVLYRVNARSRVIEEALRRRDIPYKIYRGHSFFDRKEIKDLLGYFRLIVNPRDDEAFRRIINYPARGIGDVTVAKIAALAAETGVSMWEAVEAMNAEATTKEEISLAKKTASFMELVHALALERTQLGLYQFGREVATRTGIIGGFKAENTTEAISALENIEELLNSMEIFREQKTAEAMEEGLDPQQVVSLEEWLQSVALMTDMDNEDEPENRNKVTLMTVHSAKGLEFRYVFIVGMEEEQFPALRDGGQTELEEERRLFYVALTRAKEAAWLSYSESRFQHGNMIFCRPSRFLGEIDAKYIDGALPVPRGESAQSGWDGRNTKDSPFGKWQSRKPVWEARKPAPPQKVAPVVPDGRFKKVASAPVSSAENVLRPAPEGSPFEAGMRVCHAKFGRGTVEDVEIMAGAQSSADLKIVVVFDDPIAGRKTLLSKFAKLEIL
jgi:DNA helicase-2/ATP-dependent DNA helicase PcrA